MSFVTATFLFALAAAAAPTLIHLLRRRRCPTVQWAAMAFLLDATRRQRRSIEVRDAMLLTLRTAAVALFVLAMARPFIAADRSGAAHDGPVHAVIVIDNSLSMAYTQLGRSLLDEAKVKAKAIIDGLTDDSLVTVIAACDDRRPDEGRNAMTVDAARQAIDAIRWTDRAAEGARCIERALAACRAGGEPAANRVVFFTDMQRSTWPLRDLLPLLAQLPGATFIDVGTSDRGNTAVTDLRLRDGVADAQAPAVFTATIRHAGEAPRPRTRVTMRIDGRTVEERFVDLLPDQSVRLEFTHRADVAGTGSQPLYLAAEVQVAADRLAEDDHRAVVVPLVAQAPVLFVDQYGDAEQPALNRYGETFALRRLLTAHDRAADGEPRQQRGLVRVRHIRMEQLDAATLRGSRLVVIAGAAGPDAAAADLLRRYVEQGGQLLIAAGAAFDAARWNEQAWRGGEGLLPAPMVAENASAPSPQATRRLDPASFNDPLLQIGFTDEQWRDLLAPVVILKTVRVDEQAADAAIDRFARSAAAADAPAATPALLDDAIARPPLRLTDEQTRQRYRTQVIGRYDDAQPFALRRRIGHGQVVMLTTGCFPEWNNVAVQPAVIVFDHLLRGLLAQSYPPRTLWPTERVTVAIAGRDSTATYLLSKPGEPMPTALRVEAISERQYGLMLDALDRRGIYAIQRQAADVDASWSMMLAVNGPARESDLAAVAQAEFEQVVASSTLSGLRLVKGEQAVALRGGAARWTESWKALMGAALACLLAEAGLLAWCDRPREPRAPRKGATP